MSQSLTRRAAAAALVVLSLFTAACKDGTGKDEAEPEIASMRLAVGASAVTVSANGTVTGGPLLIPRGASTLTVSYLRADGSVEPLVTPSVFRTTVTIPASVAGLTYTANPTNGLNGSFNATGATGGTVQVGLLHIAENHTDFGPFPVLVQVP